MPDGNLQQFCDDFCAAVDAMPVEQREQADDVLAFHIEWDGVPIDLITLPSISTDHLFVLMDWGLPDARRVDAARAMTALLHVNFLSLRVNQPVFGCHPESGAAMLQLSMPLKDATPAGLYQVIEQGCGLARRWREDGFLPPAAGISPPASAWDIMARGARP